MTNYLEANLGCKVRVSSGLDWVFEQVPEEIRTLTGSKSEVIHKALPKDDPKQRQPDIRFAKDAMEWQPVVILEERLKSTIAYFEQLLSIKS